jgi:hypothetical protein
MFRIGQYLPLSNFPFSGHNCSFFLSSVIPEEGFLLWFFGSVSGAALFSVLDAYRIEGAPDDMVSNSRQVFDSPSPDENDGVFLKVVPDSRDIGGDLDPIR